MIIIGGVRKNDGSLQDHLIPKINCVTLVGRVGQNPEPKYFDDGKVVLRLGLAVKRKYHPPERQARNIKYGEEETDWFNLELWGRDAEYAGKYVVKGARVGVTGSLNVDAWTDRMSGEERTSVKIVVKQLDILETRAEAQLRQNRRGSYNSNTYGTSNDNHASSGRRNSHSSSAETRQSINNQRNGIRSVFKREDLFSVANSNVYVDPEQSQSQSQSTDTSKAASANSAVIEEEGIKFNDSESKNPPRDGESSGFNDDKSDGETVTSSAQETSSPESNPRSMSLESSPNKDKNFNGGADESKNEPESTSIEHSNTMNTHENQRRISRHKNSDPNSRQGKRNWWFPW
jgi:single-strand DNA-binding protein